MTKFKTGDVVQCIKHECEADSYLYQIGKEYEVFGRGLLKDSVLIIEGSHSCSPSQDCFILVKAKQLSDVEKEFYKVYVDYEKTYLMCYPEKIHPYLQTNYFKVPKNITECEIESLCLKFDELKNILEWNKNKAETITQKEKLISLFKSWICKKIISNELSKIKKVYNNENRKYYIAINVSEDVIEPKLIYEIYRGIDDNLTSTTDNSIILSQSEYYELFKLFVVNFSDKLKKKNEKQFANFPTE